MRQLERRWYYHRLTPITALLVPFSWLFRCLIAGRILLYRLRIKKTAHFSVPIIIVGNITVGGTGKTPFVIALARLLKQYGFRPGIISRGVGGKKWRVPQRVFPDANPYEVGDESVLLARNAGCPVVVSVNRVSAAQTILQESACDVIISDDGLQHYALGRAIEIALVDKSREFGNRHLLPAGPLREPMRRLQTVDLVVRSHKQASFTLISVSDSARHIPLQSFHNKTVHAVAGIAHPQAFFAALRQQGLEIIEHVFPDHYCFQPADLHFDTPFPIIMTEKDAVKCQQFSTEHCWYLPIETQIDPVIFNQLLTLLSSSKSSPDCVL